MRSDQLRFLSSPVSGFRIGGSLAGTQFIPSLNSRGQRQDGELYCPRVMVIRPFPLHEAGSSYWAQVDEFFWSRPLLFFVPELWTLEETIDELMEGYQAAVKLGWKSTRKADFLSQEDGDAQEDDNPET